MESRTNSFTAQPRRRPVLMASLIASAAAVALPAKPAAAACVQAGNVVTCSGATNTGFGTGAENNLAVTVQPGGSVTATNPINLGDGNTVINNGTLNVNGGIGIQGVNNNTFTNAGTITPGANAAGMYAAGDNNVLTNTGNISSAAPSTYGLWLDGGTGNTVSNTGTIILSGPGSFGIEDSGFGTTITNSGTIRVAGGNFGGDGVEVGFSSKLTNNGTIVTDADYGSGVNLVGSATVINNGLIGATGITAAGLYINGANNSVVNNGTIEGVAYSLASFAATANSITNNGTLDGQILLLGTGNGLTNAGLITITHTGTAPAAGDFFIGGTFTQTAKGTLALRVDKTGLHDGLSATGQVTLNGTLRAVLQPGLYQSSTTYTNVVQSNTGVSGRFTNVTTSLAFFNAVATYNAMSVDLTLNRYGFGAAPGETANQRAVGNALEAGYSTSLSGAAAAFYTNLLQVGSVRVLDALSGEGASGTQNTAFTAGTLFGQTMDSQMTAWLAGSRGVAGGGALGYAEERPGAVTSAFNAMKAPPLAQPLWNAWVAGFGASQSLSGDAVIGSAGFSDRVAGGAIGVDHLVNPDLLVGIAAGGSAATFSVDDRATSGHVDGGHIGAYAMQRFGASYLSAQLAYSHFDNTTTRLISGVGPSETAKGAFGSDQLGGRLEIGHGFAFNAITVTPFAAVQAARLWQAGYTETSTAGALPGLLALNYAAKGVSSLPTFLGTKFDARFDVGNGMVWMPFVHAAWVHEFDPARNVTASLTSLSLPSFTVEGARVAADAGRVELGLRLALNRWWELSARATGEFSRTGQTYTGMGSLRVSW
jgi:outer membrane autotransporter protein